MRWTEEEEEEFERRQRRAAGQEIIRINLMLRQRINWSVCACFRTIVQLDRNEYILMASLDVLDLCWGRLST